MVFKFVRLVMLKMQLRPLKVEDIRKPENLETQKQIFTRERERVEKREDLKKKQLKELDVNR